MAAATVEQMVVHSGRPRAGCSVVSTAERMVVHSGRPRAGFSAAVTAASTAEPKAVH